MITLSILIFALLTDCFLAAFVALLGARRNIGFGWSFLISLIFTPIVGLIFVLLSDERPDGERKLGCIGGTLGFLGLICLVTLIFLLLGGGALIAAAL